jgi:hypothetical protein
MQHMTVHVAINEQTEDNGALHFVPGRHRWTRTMGGHAGEPLPITAADFTDMESIMDVLTQEEKSHAGWASKLPPSALRAWLLRKP